jgi:drug/metabolite transporter (DMT)-like permease
MNDHLKGILITTAGVLLVVPDSLFVRIIPVDPMITAFWRGLVSGLIILVAVLIFQGFAGFKAILGTGRTGLFYVVLIGSTTPGFVLAISNTSVANVVFIFATTPIFAAIFSRIFLGEVISRRMVLTMLVVMGGLGIITVGSAETEIASWKGDLIALYVAAAFAAALTAVRKVKEVSMIPAIPVAYMGAAIVMLFFIDPLPDFQVHWPLFTAHGAFICAATCLLTLGPRLISSAEVSLLILLESVLAPILVWIVIGEDPGPWAIVGGVVVIGALLVSNLVAMRVSNQSTA